MLKDNISATSSSGELFELLCDLKDFDAFGTDVSQYMHFVYSFSRLCITLFLLNLANIVINVEGAGLETSSFSDILLIVHTLGNTARDGVLAAYALGDAMDATTWLFERVDDAHEAKLQAVESQLSEAAGELAKVEAREKVIQDTLEQQQRELIAVSTAKMQVEAQVKATEARVTSLLTELQRSNRKKEELEQDLEDTKDALEAAHGALASLLPPDQRPQ